MIVALLQVSLNAQSRAANVQAIVGAIDRASKAMPAPDLLVLPGACDNGGIPLGRGCGPESLHVVRETIAWKAREWGVFIAAGCHCRSGDAWVPCAVLFDADGDVVVQDLDPPADREGADEGVKIWSSIVGNIGVVEPFLQVAVVDRLGENLENAFLAVPVASGGGARQLRRREATVAALRNDPAACAGAYWGVVAAAGGPGSVSGAEAPATFVCAPDGRLLVSAEDTQDTIIRVDVPIVSAMSGTQTDSGRCEGHAD